MVSVSDGVAALLSWLTYECSNTVEQRMILGGSIDKRLSDVDTHNWYTCKVAPFHGTLLRAFTYALVLYMFGTVDELSFDSEAYIVSISLTSINDTDRFVALMWHCNLNVVYIS